MIPAARRDSPGYKTALDEKGFKAQLQALHPLLESTSREEVERIAIHSHVVENGLLQSIVPSIVVAQRNLPQEALATIGEFALVSHLALGVTESRFFCSVLLTKSYTDSSVEHNIRK